MQWDRRSRSSTSLVLVESSENDGPIRCELTPPEIRALVFEGRVVIIKGAFTPQAMLDYRSAVMRWGDENAPFPHGPLPSAHPELNYHRVDDGTIPSVCPHLFHQFGFNSIEQLASYVGEPSLRIAESLRGLQNDVAGTDLPLSLTGLRLKVLHYPVGGGFLADHTHPLEPQRIGLIASMSRLRIDAKEGGTQIVTPTGRVAAGDHHDIGDVILFRYDLLHGVSPVDPNGTVDWGSSAGKWSIVLELRETHGLSHGKTP